MPEFVQELHNSANILLAHWHYYRRGIDPLLIENRESTMLSELTSEEYKFVVKAYTQMKTPSRGQ